MTTYTTLTEDDYGQAMLAMARREGHAPNRQWLAPGMMTKPLSPLAIPLIRLACRNNGVRNTAETREMLGCRRDEISYLAPKLARLGLLKTSTTHGTRLYRATKAARQMLGDEA